MIDLLQTFHFLRPWWLLALPVAALVFLNVRNRKKNDPVSSTFAPHLLPYLLVRDQGEDRFKPYHLLLLFWLVAAAALAGPSWRREPSPFAEDQAALVIVQKNTPSMLAKDIQPSRLARSAHKISDLLALRQGARTALIAYAGSSHLVMPLTSDSSVITTYAGELSPEIMPKEGDAVVEALAMAAELLAQAGSGGTILLITDSLTAEQRPALKDAAESITRFPVSILAVAGPPGTPIPADSPDAPALDRKNLEAGARIVDAAVTVVSHDSADVEEINTNIVRSHTLHLSGGDGERWRDGGYLLIPVLLVLGLVWCRKGWYVRWEVHG